VAGRGRKTCRFSCTVTISRVAGGGPPRGRLTRAAIAAMVAAVSGNRAKAAAGGAAQDDLRPPDYGPEAQRVRRIGVIDVGSNSVRLVVFDGMARSPAYFYNEKVLAGLGAGLKVTGKLSRKGRERAIGALRRFAGLARRMNLSGMSVVATAAVRAASDGRDFLEAVERETGLRIQIASGAEEARLAAQGVLLGWPDADGVVSDLGGASMELARLRGGAVGETETSDLGPLQLANLPDRAARERAVRKGMKALRQAVPGPVARLFLVGGSWRALARLDMERRGYPLRVLHGYEPPVDQLLETASWIGGQSVGDMAKATGISTDRLSLVPYAAEVLLEMVARLDPERVAVSAFGLREGLLYRQMPEAMRRRDPLIEACRHLEKKNARCAGFGAALYEWLLPLYPAAPEADRRLVRAACLLHDVNWRGHPDFRAELAFETVTRANISGLDHPSRVFLGLALMNRYKTGASDAAARYAALISPERAHDAQVLGRAMRLGAMLSGASTGVLEHTALEPEGNRLRLRLTGPARAFMGEAVGKRLQPLAQKLALEPEVVFD
jgi:exopolyphosphatase / guanosine-5'-triphosphate,3'-diphosphate pyrophosphatase